MADVPILVVPGTSTLGAVHSSSSPGDRLKALRELLGISQPRLAELARRHSGGAWVAQRISKLENGKLKFRSADARTDLARAFGLDLDSFSRYLEGELSLEDVSVKAQQRAQQNAALAASQPQAVTFHRSAETDHKQSADRSMEMAVGSLGIEGMGRKVHYPKLEAALAYADFAYDAAAIAACRNGLFGPEDVSGPEWTRRLEMVQSALRRVRAELSGRGDSRKS